MGGLLLCNQPLGLQIRPGTLKDKLVTEGHTSLDEEFIFGFFQECEGLESWSVLKHV